MKKFGFSKKSEGGGGGGEDDTNRNALFGSRKSKTSDQSSNPYAQQPANNDPYAQQNDNKYGASPYQQAKQQYATPGGGLPNGPGPNRNAYGNTPPAVNRDPAPNGGGYGNDRYGSGGGYGANRYDAAPPSYRSDAGSVRQGGYGGLGRTNSNETTSTDDNRDQLFGGARSRFEERGPQGAGSQNGPPGGYGGNQGPDGGANGGPPGGYGAYGEERQLTAEEEEEEDVAATKQQIKFMKQEDVSSTRNALRIAQQAEETGRATLARLGAQGERIHNTEKNLDVAASHNRMAEEKAKELKTLNRSMWAVHVANPFTANSRRAKADEQILARHQSEREEREATRKAQWGSQQRMEDNFRTLQPGDVGYRAPQTKANLAERSKYQFEADSEDDEMENEIDSNLDALSHAAGRLNLLARATGEEVDRQNEHITRISAKVSTHQILAALVLERLLIINFTE